MTAFALLTLLSLAAAPVHAAKPAPAPSASPQTAAAPVAPPSARDVLTSAKFEFSKGNFRQALKILADAEAGGTEFTATEKLDSIQLQALSHVYLGEPKEAQTYFRELLLINPDYFLDPLIYGEEARNVVVATRMDPELQPKLAVRREEIRQAKLREAEAKKAAEEAEKRRKELAAIPEQVPIVVRHSALLNVLPFGIPQIEQDRPMPGILFAVAQGVTITTSVLTYTVVQTQFLRPDGLVDSDKVQQAKAWRLANWVSVGAAGAVYLAGVIDAFVAHKEQGIKLISRDEYLKLRDEGRAVPTLAPTTPAPELQPTPASAYPKPNASLYLSPVPGGAAVGLVGRF
ncbi:MAG: hypothetical protein QM765_05340 [Myxococcales bacterium]